LSFSAGIWLVYVNVPFYKEMSIFVSEKLWYNLENCSWFAELK